MSTVISFFKEVRDEVDKIVWPTREQTIRYTTLVIITAAATGLILGGFDYLLTLITSSFLGTGS